ncbi:MAG: response regulator [Elusimicrobiota bacterium]|jgi:DNA-binding response OmpR family regulator
MAEKLILVVDDEADVARILERWLGRVPGLKVISVLDGAQALEAAQRNRPDLVILDYSMPMMDGFETCRALRADALTKTVPVIMLSGLGAAGAAMEAEGCGADAYLSKPLDGRELVDCVQLLLNRSAAPR